MLKLLELIHAQVVTKLNEFDPTQKKSQSFLSIVGNGENFLHILNYGTNHDIMVYMDVFRSVLPIGVKEYVYHLILRKRAPHPLCHPHSPSLHQEPMPLLSTFKVNKQLLWSASFSRTGSIMSSPVCSTFSNMSNYHFHDSYPIYGSAAVKSLAITATTAKSNSASTSSTGTSNPVVHLLACSKHGTATYSLTADTDSGGTSSSATVSLSPHRNVRYPFASITSNRGGCVEGGLLSWRLGAPDTVDLLFVDNCLNIPSVITICPKPQPQSHSPATPPQSCFQQHKYSSSSSSTFSSSNHVPTFSTNGSIDYEGGHQKSMRVERNFERETRDSDSDSDSQDMSMPMPMSSISVNTAKPDNISYEHTHGLSLNHGGGRLNITTVLSCDASPDGSSVAILVEGHCSASTVDLSTRLVACADGESDVDSDSFSIGSAGRTDLLEMRYRIRTAEARRISHPSGSSSGTSTASGSGSGSCVNKYSGRPHNNRVLNNMAYTVSDDGSSDFGSDSDEDEDGMDNLSYSGTYSDSDVSNENRDRDDAEVENIHRFASAFSSVGAVVGMSDEDSTEDNRGYHGYERGHRMQARAAATAAFAGTDPASTSMNVNANVNVINNNGWDSDHSQVEDSMLHETSLLTVKRRYYVIFCNVFSGAVNVTGVASLQSSPLKNGLHASLVPDVSGLQMNQLPCIIRCVRSGIAIVAGTGGLLSLVSEGGISCQGFTEQSQFFSLTCDDFVPSSFSGGGGSDAKVSAGATTTSASTKSNNTGNNSTDEYSSARKVNSHASSSNIFALDFVSQAHTPASASAAASGYGYAQNTSKSACTGHTTLKEVALVSADTDGFVALWHLRLLLPPEDSIGRNIKGAVCVLLNTSLTPLEHRVYGVPHHFCAPTGPALQLSGHVQSLVIAPSGCTVMATVNNQLLVLSQSQSGAGLYVRTALDLRRLSHSPSEVTGTSTGNGMHGKKRNSATLSTSSHMTSISSDNDSDSSNRRGHTRGICARASASVTVSNNESDSSDIKLACTFEGDKLWICKISSIPGHHQSGSGNGASVGVCVDCWSVPSPDRFQSRMEGLAFGASAGVDSFTSEPIRATPSPLVSSFDFARLKQNTEIYLPVVPPTRFQQVETEEDGVSHGESMNIEVPSSPQLMYSAKKMEKAHVPLQVPVPVLLPEAWRAPPPPTLLPHSGWSCEEVLTAIFGGSSSIGQLHTHSQLLQGQGSIPAQRSDTGREGNQNNGNTFDKCKLLLSIYLASLSVSIGPFIPASAISSNWHVDANATSNNENEGPSLGLLAAALDVDVTVVHRILCTYYNSLRHLMCYEPPVETDTTVADDNCLEALSPSLSHLAMDSTSCTSTLNISSDASVAGTSGSMSICTKHQSQQFQQLPHSPSDQHHKLLSETILRPTDLLLRGGLAHYLCSTDAWRLGASACVGPLGTAAGGGGFLSGWSSHSTGSGSFWVDQTQGHEFITALFLKNCGNKSVAMEHRWQDYLRQNGPSHLRRSGRGLRELTRGVRKIDETAGLKETLPRQLGFVSGLQEIYARRVGLTGRLPEELCMLQELRVLSMGNNMLSGSLPFGLGILPHLQRIVLHQNNLSGSIPPALANSGCIVNLAGNSQLDLGPDVPESEREALQGLYYATDGDQWGCRTHWCDRTAAVQNWYKVGTLAGHVHSLVMSSNGMRGNLPLDMTALSCIRMIELATMPELTGSLEPVCSLVTLRRLCVCRCSLSGPIPDAIGQLQCLEELQLFGNKLNGEIPDSLGNLRNLKLLSLGEYTGGNNFAPGPLPPCIRRLKLLEALFISSCHITGVLPEWIGELSALRQLDVQHNDVSGQLPSSLSQLSSLLYLNFKDNTKLTGVLPVRQLSNLRLLNRLSFVNTDIMSSPTLLKQLQRALPRCKIWN